MNTQELRIGNLMQDREGRICKVERLSIDPDENRISAINGAITSLPIEPIPLTEEWLLKFGFEVEQSIIRSDRKTYKKSGFKYYNGNDYFEYLSIPLVINYVHQLQDLHFALTGLELTLK